MVTDKKTNQINMENLLKLKWSHLAGYFRTAVWLNSSSHGDASV